MDPPASRQLLPAARAEEAPGVFASPRYLALNENNSSRQSRDDVNNSAQARRSALKVVRQVRGSGGTELSPPPSCFRGQSPGEGLGDGDLQNLKHFCN